MLHLLIGNTARSDDGQEAESQEIPMSYSPLSRQSGKTSTTVINALVAIAFIAFCAVVAVYYLQLSDGSGKSAADKSQKKPAAKAEKKAGAYLDIKFYSSSAKKNWINKLVKEFNAAHNKVGDKQIRVTVSHVTSGGSYDNLVSGKTKPDIWSPGDESWLHLAAAHWRDVKQRPLFDDFKPLVNIPLVIAVWEPMAKVLGYPNPIGWKDIAKVASNPEGWAALGHPEWGKFRWGHAHPDANSGFLAVISILYAATGKTEGMTTEDLKRPEVIEFLRNFEEAVEHYGLSNSWINKLMHSKGPAYLSAAVQYENTIIQTNTKHKNRPFKLVAVYPSEGGFWTQHPVAIIKEQWMTPEKEKACSMFIDFLLGRKAQELAMEMGLRPISSDVTLASPFDEEHGVKLQVATDRAFKVPSEAVLKRIRDLWENVKAPATISLVLDVSGSMKGEPMEKAKQGAVQFIQSMKPRDQLEVVIFGDKSRILMPLCPVRDCGEKAAGRLDVLFAAGQTTLYDAISTAYQRLLERKQQDPNRRYGMVVLSDGKDTRSKLDRHDFLDSLPKGEDFDAPKIFTIAYGGKADTALLKQVSNRTNGRLFSSSVDKIARTYKELSANF
jgi:Ca-activated chloride channel homolog